MSIPIDPERVIMPAKLTSRGPNRLVIEVEIPLRSSFDATEGEISEALNEAGRLATGAALEEGDDAGDAFVADGVRYTTKGLVAKQYETPYGPVPVGRRVYQSSRGGATRCPLDARAGIVRGATPRFAGLVAWKYAELGAAQVQQDLARHHGRRCSRALIEGLAWDVASLAELRSGRGPTARPPAPDLEGPPVAEVVLRLDLVPLAGVPDLPPAALAGFELHDRAGRIVHRTYLARIPGPLEAEDQALLKDVGKQVDALRKAWPSARWLGITGDRPTFRSFFREREIRQVLDPGWLEARLGEAVAAIPGASASGVALSKEVERLTGPLRPASGDGPAPGEGARDAAPAVDPHGERLAVFADRLSGLRRAAKASGDPVASERVERCVRPIRELLDREPGLLDYRPPIAEGLWDRPGPLAELAEALVGDRFRHVRFKMGLPRARAILALRGLVRSDGQWDRFLQAIAGRRRHDRD